MPKLAKVYLKYEEAIDIEELKKMFAKKKQIEEGEGRFSYDLARGLHSIVYFRCLNLKF